MTHGELVARVQRWLRSSRHPVALAEISGGREIADVIGWKTDGRSTLVECKVSRSDFLRDAKKSVRRQTFIGLGQHRFFAFPDGMNITPEEVPDKWGLLRVSGHRVFLLKKAERFADHDVQGETRILVSAVRRATEKWGRKVYGDISPVHGQLDPHPSVHKLISS